jgi:hypothetical protein
VLDLVLILIGVLFFLSVLLWVGTLFFQGLIYNEPAPDLYWRGPASGAALTALAALWCLLAYRGFDPHTDTQLPLDTIFRFQPKQTVYVDKLWSVKKNAENPILFTKRVTSSQPTIGQPSGRPSTEKQIGMPAPSEFRDADNVPWTRADTTGITEAILIEEAGQKVRFEPKLTSDGNFTKADAFPGYYEANGRRVMDQLGQVTIFLYGRWLLNIFFNVLLFGLWFVCLWLILRFQWPHAFGLAVAFWVAMTLFLLPMLLDRTRDVAKQRAASTPAPAASSISSFAGCAARASAKPQAALTRNGEYA